MAKVYRENRNCNSTRSCSLTSAVVSCLISMSLLAYLWSKTRQLNTKIDLNSTKENTYFTAIWNYLSWTEPQEELSPLKSQSFHGWRLYIADMFQLIGEDIQLLYLYIGDLAILCLELNILFIGCIVVALILLINQISTRSRQKLNNSKSKRDKNISKEIADYNRIFFNGGVFGTYIDHVTRSWWRILVTIIVISFLLSIPWEFVRLYQVKVAEKVAIMEKGTPPECVPEKMSVIQSLQAWFHHKFSWEPNPCQIYHTAILVDPVWEIPPLMVLSSALTRCLIHPVEIIFSGLGRAFRVFFSEIPAPWQPVLMTVMVIFLVLTLIMTCSYRLHLPFLLKLEPITPIILKKLASFRNQGITMEEKKKLEFTEEDTDIR